MDPRFIVTREEFHDVQMDLKRVHSIQQQQSERIRLLEKRQADDAALKSVWNSPFPSVLGGTPQHGPVHMPQNEVFSDDLDDQSQNLLGSLHLEAEDEPIRRGAASRANSVRFDESALHGAGWGAHSGRHSGDFGPIRPTSGMGGHQMMERSLSHKSDGRHSSAGHSVHSMHSGVSGRVSSLGLDTNFSIGGHEDESPIDMPEPPPGLFVMGSAPSIIRCWLTTNYTSKGLLYAVVCTGSQKSTVEYSLVKDLDLTNNIHRDLDGVHRITLPVFLAEARVTQSNSRSTSPTPQLPSITCSFEVTGMDQQDLTGSGKSIRVFIGSHTLRMHSADLLLSQNSMTLYGSDRDKLSVPFVRPEDDAVFKNLTTANIVPGKVRLNAAAPEFVSGEKTKSPREFEASAASGPEARANGSEGLLSPGSRPDDGAKAAPVSTESDSGGEGEKHTQEAPTEEASGDKDSQALGDGNRREPSVAIRTPWRQTAMGMGSDSGSRDSTPLSGYQPATRVRSMKVLRPTKSSSSSSAKTGAAYEPAPAPRSSGEHRRKTLGESIQQSSTTSSSVSSWGNAKRSMSTSTSGTLAGFGGMGDGRLNSPATSNTEAGKQSSAPRSANNPLGSASAFSWIASNKPKTPATMAD
ncbi:hypothetical protein QBC34DRAFT_11936 [Podospora aff. communis PSN243]|uniref:Ubiquitin carboxyl-terminal hydrolase 19 n=1 Tax=Podospora aff. communis PSN243 TaxID=3040156 RepID=A0AAV9H8D7_9PEZI|nr:hypothetical protein QBC34DRAFT_11936 [Podospora aff. communis PSN243]